MSNVAFGMQHANAKLTEADIKVIRKSSETLSALARRYGVARQTIRAVRRGNTWKHVV